MRRLLVFGRMLCDGRVPLRLKLGFLIVAIGYLLFPIDLLPDLLPVIGIMDDGAILLLSMGLFTRFARKYFDASVPDAESEADLVANNRYIKGHEP